jgi:DNA polymerase I
LNFVSRSTSAASLFQAVGRFPVCLVGHEIRSGRTVRLWRDEFDSQPPWPSGPDILFVAYFASAELGCCRVLGWPAPLRILDLYTEFRCLTNGLPVPAGRGLLGALTYYGIDGIGAIEKDEMRDLVLRGGPWSAEERSAILDYCDSDVMAMARLLPRMAPPIEQMLGPALLRGRYMAAVAAMEHHGVPIDMETLDQVRAHWGAIKDQLITAVDASYGIYSKQTFKHDRFESWLQEQGIEWPRLPSGHLELKESTFREMAKGHPEIAPLHELRSTLSELRLNKLAVGPDARNRTLLSPFQSLTGRNQPGNSKFVFGPATWIRGLIKPPVGHAIAYIDWSQQEFGIAAALSRDPEMQAAYASGDPYLALGERIGVVPPGATKDTHTAEREMLKVIVLAMFYGMREHSFAGRIGRPVPEAKQLLLKLREAFPVFWAWSERSVDWALLLGEIKTVFHWRFKTVACDNRRTLANFPMQANGAEMMRLACCYCTEAGIEVCAPVHDALLICAPLEQIESDAARTQAFMQKAGRIVLGGFLLKSDAKIVRWPDRYMDRRGEVMWATIMRLLEEVQHERFRSRQLPAEPGTVGGYSAATA